MILHSSILPGILSWNSHLLPGPLISASLISLVIVSLTRPDGSPPTFTIMGLPVVAIYNYNVICTIKMFYLFLLHLNTSFKLHIDFFYTNFGGKCGAIQWRLHTCHMVISKSDVEQVYSWLVGLVTHGVFAVSFFFAFYVRPMWTLDGER